MQSATRIHGSIAALLCWTDTDTGSDTDTGGAGVGVSRKEAEHRRLDWIDYDVCTAPTRMHVAHGMADQIEHRLATSAQHKHPRRYVASRTLAPMRVHLTRHGVNATYSRAVNLATHVGNFVAFVHNLKYIERAEGNVHAGKTKRSIR